MAYETHSEKASLETRENLRKVEYNSIFKELPDLLERLPDSTHGDG